MKPLLCVIDIQKEYVTEGRMFCIPQIEASIGAAKSMLGFARESGWSVVHVRHLQDGQIFSRANEYSDYVPGFEPRAGEIEVSKGNYSCFSSSEFCNVLEQNRQRKIVVVGYGSAMCCLSTIVEGYHRGFDMTFVSDASNAKPTAVHSSAQIHEVMTDVMGTFAKVVTASEARKL